nr:MAG TPA: hypothetical protein [Caudoviricetes sp.]
MRINSHLFLTILKRKQNLNLIKIHWILQKNSISWVRIQILII